MNKIDKLGTYYDPARQMHIENPTPEVLQALTEKAKVLREGMLEMLHAPAEQETIRCALIQFAQAAGGPQSITVHQHDNRQGLVLEGDIEVGE